MTDKIYESIRTAMERPNYRIVYEPMRGWYIVDANNHKTYGPFWNHDAASAELDRIMGYTR